MYLCPLLLVLHPTSQTRGNSATIYASVRSPEHCRSSRVICSGRFGSPALRRGLGVAGGAAASGLGFGTGFSRPLIAVASRLMCPTSLGPSVFSISAAWTRCGNSLRANSAKAREKMVSSGTWAAASQPQMRRNAASLCNRSNSARVGGEVENGLGHEGPPHGSRIVSGTSPAMLHTHESVQLQHRQGLGQLLMPCA